MSAFVRKILSAVVVATACLIVGFMAWETSARLRGEIEARFDVKLGRYAIQVYGLPSASRPRFTRLLQEKYGVEVRVAAGCVVSASTRAYVQGYNAVSKAAANRKFGRDIFEETEAEAIKNIGQETRR